MNFTPTYGSAVSSDGNFVGGLMIAQGNTPWRTWTWTKAGGLEALPGVTRQAQVRGVTNGRQLVVGTDISQAFYWTPTSPALNPLPRLPGTSQNYANGVAQGARVIVGSSKASPSTSTAVRWTFDGASVVTTALPSLQPGFSSNANAVSADGQFAVGFSGSSGGNRAVVWQGTTISRTLGPAPGYLTSEALAVSPGGETVVGFSTSGSVRRATVWRADGSANDLGSFGATASFANAVSTNGEVIAGGAFLPNGSTFAGYSRAFRWTEASGMVDLNSLAASRGIQLGSLILMMVESVSADGNVMTGYGIDTNSLQYQGFVMTIPAPSAVVGLAVFAGFWGRRRWRR